MSGKGVLQVTQQDFDQEVLKADLPVLVDFWAVWCGPCKAIAPLVAEISQEYRGRLKVCSLDVDNAQQIAMTYGIRSIPTLLLFKDGKVVGQKVGALPKNRLQEFVDTAL